MNHSRGYLQIAQQPLESALIGVVSFPPGEVANVPLSLELSCPSTPRIANGVVNPDWEKIEKGSGRIVGAHLLTPEASELINVFGVAMRGGLGAAHLKRLVSAYPSARSHIVHLV
jgi:hypothetical protein